MVFVGFGLLMAFLKTHCWTSVGFSFLIACWVIQLNMLMQPFWGMIVADNFQKITISLQSLVDADYAAAAVLITLGALIGKVSWT